jgi:hypothetical protein
VDDAGDGHGPVRTDIVQLNGAEPGATAVLRWTRVGDFPAPATVRVVLHGLLIGGARADGEPATVIGSTVECGPFGELVLEGLRRVPGARP